MKKYRIVVTIFLVTLTLTSCRSMIQESSAPLWIESPYDATYPENRYLCSIGVGTTRENAINAAYSSLSQIFSAKVSSVVTTYGYSSSESEGDSLFFTNFDSMIDQGRVESESAQIIGTQVVNTWVDSEGKVWVRIALDREKSASLYEREADELEKRVESIRNLSNQESSFASQFFLLREALPYALSHQNFANQIQFLSSKRVNSLLYPLEKELKERARKITMFIEVDGVDEMSENSLYREYASLYSDYGFQVVKQKERANTTLVVNYFVEKVSSQDSPYIHVRYTLSSEIREKDHLIEASHIEKRESALSIEDAYRSALRSALSSIE